METLGTSKEANMQTSRRHGRRPDGYQGGNPAAIHHALIKFEQDTTTEVNAMITQPRIIGTKEINEELAKDATTKELKQMVERGASEDAEDGPKDLRNHHKNTQTTL